MISRFPDDITTTITETPILPAKYGRKETPPKFLHTERYSRMTANITNSLDYGLAEQEVEVL